jgi:hypothetical protein
VLCDTARDRLLTADDPARADPDVAEHVAGCAACRAVAADLAAFEQAIRAYPTPAAVLVRRDAFLNNLASPAPRPIRVRHIVAAFATLAASVIVCVATVALMRSAGPDGGPTQPVAQADPVMEDLVEWNLKLTETETPADREKLVRNRLPELQSAVQTASLSADDRTFAEQLLAYGRKLGGTADAVDEAEGFHDLADTLLVRLDTAAEDPARSVVYARLYSQVVDRGVDVNLARAEKQALKVEKQVRVKNLERAKLKQAAKAAALADRISERARENMKGGKTKIKGGNPSPK